LIFIAKNPFFDGKNIRVHTIYLAITNNFIKKLWDFMTKPELSGLINKSVHTSDGVYIGNVHHVSDSLVLIKREVVARYYNIPKNKFERWDGHALWLNITEDEAKKDHLIKDHSTNDTITTKSFRMDVDVVKKLRLQAEHEGMTLNSSVKHTLLRFVQWDMFEPYSGLVPLAKPVVAELFGKRDRAEIIEMATRVGKDAVLDAAFTIKGKIDLNSFLSFLESEMNHYATHIRHNIESETHTYTLKHELGENWSVYFKTVLDLIFKEVLKKHVDTSISKSALAFRFEGL